MIEDEVKQTRCSTCDADHEYKQAKVPSPRRPKTVAAIQEGAEGFEAKPVLAPPRPAADADSDADGALPPDPPDLEEPAEAPIAPTFLNSPGEPAPLQASGEPAAAEPIDEPGNHEDEGPVHRRLIRATLPRPEGHVPERKEPEFTIRQPGARGPGGREVDGNSVGYRPKSGQRQGGFGHGGGGGHSRFGGQRHGSGQPQRHGAGRGPNNQQRGGRPDGAGNSRGQQRGPGSGRRRGGR